MITNMLFKKEKGSKNMRKECIHLFVDIFNEKEEIDSGVINLAGNCQDPENIAIILNAGKLKTKTHVLTYCRHCGVKL